MELSDYAFFRPTVALSALLLFATAAFSFGADAPTPTARPPGRRVPRVNGIPEFHGIRGSNYVYVEYKTGEKEFYDLTTDPYELNNIVGKLDRTTLEALVARVDQLATCHADTCRAAEDQPLAITVPSGS